MTPKIPISDLLAHRDGDHIDPQVSAEIEADPESRASLKTLREIKHALVELPGIEPPAEVWQNIESRQPLKRTDRHERSEHRAGLWGSPSWANLATAATVFFAVALSILWWNPMEDGGLGAQAEPLSDIVARSQTLESQVFYPQSSTSLAAVQQDWNSSQQALLYRIADVDSELNQGYDNQLLDPREREKLWRQRVKLLQSLQEVQRRQKPSQMALY